MTEKKSILIWVFEDEKNELLQMKGEQTWREFLLDLARVPYAPIQMGRPRIKEGVSNG